MAMQDALEKMQMDRPGSRIRFTGSPTEVAHQYCHALQSMRECIDGYGAKAIDYESVFMPRGSYSHGHELEATLGKFYSLKRVGNRAFAKCDETVVAMWVMCRARKRQVRDKDTGVLTWQPWSIERAIDELGVEWSKTSAWRKLKKLDGQLFGRLNTGGWVV